MVRAIRSGVAPTRVELGHLLGLSASTITRIVARLIDEGLVVEGEAVERAISGRRPTALSINDSAYHLAGVEITGTSLTAALANLAGEIVLEHQCALPDSGPDEAVEATLVAIGSLLSHARDGGYQVRGIGIGAPGVTDPITGRVLWAATLGWRDLPLRDIVAERFGISAFVENDVNLAGVGEHWMGAGADADPMSYLHVGPGIGAATILRGELLRGAHSIAGEVGHLVPDRRYLTQQHLSIGAMESVLAGQPLVDSLDHVAMLLLALATVVDPAVVVLGGELADLPADALQGLRDRLARVAPAVPDLRPAKLGARAGVLGAAAFALLHVEDLHPSAGRNIHA